MINKIKDKLYEVLSSNYEGNQIVDNASAVEEGSYPRIQIRLSTVNRDFYNGTFLYVIRYQVHIFSDYDGQKEILDMESTIFKALKQFYTIDGVTYARESGFRILDDKSTGIFRKHGIVSLTFYCSGEEVDDDNSQTAPQGG